MVFLSSRRRGRPPRPGYYFVSESSVTGAWTMEEIRYIYDLVRTGYSANQIQQILMQEGRGRRRTDLLSLIRWLRQDSKLVLEIVFPYEIIKCDKKTYDICECVLYYPPFTDLPVDSLEGCFPCKTVEISFYARYIVYTGIVCMEDDPCICIECRSLFGLGDLCGGD